MGSQFLNGTSARYKLQAKLVGPNQLEIWRYDALSTAGFVDEVVFANCIGDGNAKKRGTGKRGTMKNTGVENAGLENVGPNRMGGIHGTGKRRTKFPGWKTHDHRLLNAKWISIKLKRTLYDMYIILLI